MNFNEKVCGLGVGEAKALNLPLQGAWRRKHFVISPFQVEWLDLYLYYHCLWLF